MPPPQMTIFDAPTRESCIARRERTNTPLQALQLLNDVQHFEAARAFASRIMAAAETPDSRVEFAYRTVLARRPSPEESAIVLDFFNRQRTKYKDAPEEAKKTIQVGESKPPADVDEAELAAWTLVANLILNLDEAIVRN